MPSKSLRSYQEDKCKQLVLDKYNHAIKTKFGHYVHLCFSSHYSWNDYHPDTPRLRAVSGQVPCASFYYTEFLVEIAPDRIYDIGCGINFFKDILPNVVGIDAQGFYDIQDVFDKEFVAGHDKAFRAVMSIDALHFIPLTDFRERVMDFSCLVAPGGRGYLAMNLARMWDHTPADLREDLWPDAQRDPGQLIDYIDQELDQTGLDFLVRDNLISQQWDDFVDGNIRLVFQK